MDILFFSPTDMGRKMNGNTTKKQQYGWTSEIVCPVKKARSQHEEVTSRVGKSTESRVSARNTVGGLCHTYLGILGACFSFHRMTFIQSSDFSIHCSPKLHPWTIHLWKWAGARLERQSIQFLCALDPQLCISWSSGALLWLIYCFSNCSQLEQLVRSHIPGTWGVWTIRIPRPA